MSTLFLRNPRLTILTIGLITVAGLSSYVVLPRMEDPLLTERAAFILTALPGADAVQVEALITEPIEDELREFAEIKKIRSASRSSLSTITVELRDDIYGDEAATVWSRIRDRVSDVEAVLPPEATKPRFERIEVTAYTRLIALIPDTIAPTSDNRKSKSQGVSDERLPVLRRLAEVLRERLLAVPGTRDVDIFGDPKEEITVIVRPEQLASIGLTAQELSGRIQASDARVSAGQLRSERTDLLIEVSGELDSLSRIAAIPIQTSVTGHVVNLGDIAEVHRGVTQPPSDLALVHGRQAIVLACLIRPDQRIDSWDAASRKVTEQFRDQLPQGIQLVDVFSQDGYVTDRLDQLQSNLLIGAGSVMVVILFMMGWRSAVVVGVSLPLSALMVLSGMRLLNIPVHQMSVTGLIIALGLLIDNAIVVVDEVSQRLRNGQSATEAVGHTVRQLAVPLFGSTFTTALAFAPIAIMPGPAGEFVGSIAVNVMVAIFSSLLLALTVVPALTGFLGHPSRLTSDAVVHDHWISGGWRNATMLRAYRSFLHSVIRIPVLGIGLGVILPLAGFLQARLLPEQFFPPADRDQIALELEVGPQASLQETLRTAEAVRDELLNNNTIEEVSWWVGRSAPPFYYNQIAARRGLSRYAQALVKLRSAENLVSRINVMQRQLDQKFPGSRIVVRQLEQGPPFEAPIEVQVFGPDLEELAIATERIHAVMAGIPEVTHIRSESAEIVPRLIVRLDEDETRLAGLDHQSVSLQMAAALEGAVGGLVMEGTEELPVRVRVENENRSSVDAVEALEVVARRPVMTSGSAATIPLSVLGQVELKSEQPFIMRENRRRMTEIQAFLEAGVLPAGIQKQFQQRLSAAGLELPPGYELKFGGESAQRDDAIRNLLASVGVLAVMMVAALVLSFRSFRLAGLIGAVAFLSVGLGMGSLWIFGFPFGFMAIIGTMGLVGVAINDSIVVLAALREDEAAAGGDIAAIREVVIRSTRHVLATSLTTIAGFLPLILVGGGFWPPLAVTIAGGVGGATLIALVLVPAVFHMQTKAVRP
ncbi:MAG: efflux RND transporter permease subunit [Planctomycetaceae bacterium]